MVIVQHWSKTGDVVPAGDGVLAIVSSDGVHGVDGDGVLNIVSSDLVHGVDGVLAIVSSDLVHICRPVFLSK